MLIIQYAKMIVNLFVDKDYSSQKAHSSCKVKESFFFLMIKKNY